MKIQTPKWTSIYEYLHNFDHIKWLKCIGSIVITLISIQIQIGVNQIQSYHIKRLKFITDIHKSKHSYHKKNFPYTINKITKSTKTNTYSDWGVNTENILISTKTFSTIHNNSPNHILPRWIYWWFYRFICRRRVYTTISLVLQGNKQNL